MYIYNIYNKNSFVKGGIEIERFLDNLALDAYVYGFPLVLMDITKRTGLGSVTQMNRFYNQRMLSTPGFTQVVRPNVDTLYSSAWLDLSKGPLLLHVPNTNDRYYVLPLLDAWSNVFASIGARTTGTKEGLFAIVGPGWKGRFPRNISKIYAPTNAVWIVGRTQTNSPEDYPLVHVIQDNYTLIRVNQPYNITKRNSFLPHPTINSQQSPKDLVTSIDAATFFNLMMKAMYQNPPYPAIQSSEMNLKLRSLHLIPSQNFNFNLLPPSIQRSLAKAVQMGPKIIEVASKNIFRKSECNGWSMLLKNMGYYGTDYMQRAVVAMTLFGANILQDAVYAYRFMDGEGIPLHGKNDYRIHFASGQTPPVHAFWSITLYNREGFLVENRINRYGISPHLAPLNYHADGTLEIYIQNQSPGIDRETNWLPSPKGIFNLMLRMYWPKAPVLFCSWHPPAVVRNG